MKKLHLLNLIIIVFFLASCQEDDIEKTTEELIIGEWQWVAEDGNPRNLEIEYSQPYNYGNCELDGVNIDYKLEKEYKITFRDDLYPSDQAGIVRYNTKINFVVSAELQL
jgi:hypothetical protein